MKERLVFSLPLLLLAASFALADDKIPGINPGEVKKLHGGFQFTEGPATDREGNLYFSDIPANKIHHVDPSGKLSVFLDPSNHTNGLMINAAGELYACEMDGRIVKIDLKTKKVAPVASEYEGKRFNAPNDLVLDKAGGVYFTDPHFRAPMPLPQGKRSVYYASAEGKVTRIIDDLPAPNGVILSPDEKTLYVIPTLSADMLAYPVEGPGKLGEKKVFCTLAQPEGAKMPGGGDGLTIDSQGNLYITSALGLQVFSSSGKALGIIKFPEQPSNATFGGPDNDTLYVTARTSVYTCKVEVKGHRFPGKSAGEK